MEEDTSYEMIRLTERALSREASHRETHWAGIGELRDKKKKRTILTAVGLGGPCKNKRQR